MTSWRPASCITSSPGIRRRLLARKPAEYGADRQAEAAKEALGENVPGHVFARREHILKCSPAFIDDARAFVHRDAHVCKRDPRPQRQTVKRWTIDRN